MVDWTTFSHWRSTLSVTVASNATDCASRALRGTGALAGRRGDMNAYHYLGFQPMVGRSLWYGTTGDNRWVALLGWGAAALKRRPRHAWIVWTPALKWRRLHLPDLPRRRELGFTANYLRLNNLASHNGSQASGYSD